MADKTTPTTKAPGAAPEIPASGIPANIPVIPSAQERLSVPVSSALDLDESPKVSLEKIDKAVRDKQPTDKLPKPGISEPRPGKHGKGGKVSKPAVTPPPATPVTPPPVATPPAAPATPATPPPATPPPAAPPVEPAKPAKVKVGSKEYTEEELAAILAQKEAPPVAPAAPAPAAAQPADVEPTPEQIAAETKAWVENASQHIPVELTEQQVETILGGGKESVAMVAGLLKNTGAHAALTAQKSVLGILNQSLLPGLKKLREQHEQVFANYQQLQRYEVQAQFVAKYPEFVPHADRARSVAESLIAQYPEECAKLGTEGFIQEVAAQTDRILSVEFKRWNPNFNGTWKDYAKQTAAPAPTAPPVSAVAAVGAPTAVPASPAAPAIPPVQPPAANLPTNAPSLPSRSWHQQTASSLI